MKMGKVNLNDSVDDTPSSCLLLEGVGWSGGRLAAGRVDQEVRGDC